MSKIKNRGVKLGYRSTDYVAGALPYEVRNESGDWTPFLPEGELQRSPNYGLVDGDWMDCVSRSATNSIEIQEKQQTGVVSNYCDREVALGSGTTREGNYLWKVADYIRSTGLAQQSSYPDSGGDFDAQYQPIPSIIRQKLDIEKKEWLTKWDVKDEDIPVSKDSFLKHLKHAPIQVVIPGHAIVEILRPADVDRIFDSYPPYVKNVPGDYPGPIIFAKKIVLYKKTQAIPDGWLLVDIKYLDAGKQVQKLRNALIINGWGYSSDKDGKMVEDVVNWPDIYDRRLANRVLGFQKANLSHFSWAYWWALWKNGELVEATTREKLNKLIK